MIAARPVKLWRVSPRNAIEAYGCRALGALMTTLFYPPLFSALVFEPPQIVDLITSLVVALAVGQLAGKLRRQMVQATEGERTIRRIY